jgi:hypothetical protein
MKSRAQVLWYFFTFNLPTSWGLRRLITFCGNYSEVLDLKPCLFVPLRAQMRRHYWRLCQSPSWGNALGCSTYVCQGLPELTSWWRAGMRAVSSFGAFRASPTSAKYVWMLSIPLVLQSRDCLTSGVTQPTAIAQAFPPLLDTL